MDATANGDAEMELTMEELNMESRELTIDDLDNASGGVPLELMMGLAVFGAFFCLGTYIRIKLF